MRFFRTFLASLLGSFIAMGLVFLFFLIGIIGFVSFISKPNAKKINVSTNSVLTLKLDRSILDRTTSLGDFQENTFGIRNDVIGLDKLTKVIISAKNDKNIKGINLEITPFFSAGWTQIRTLRETLKKFKESGKFVYSYSDIYLKKGYYFESVSDSIFINPLGIKMDVIRYGNYKSAVEPYLKNQMSAENRMQIKLLLNSLWGTIQKDIAISRKIPEKKVNEIAEKLLTSEISKAIDLKIIDGKIQKSDYYKKLKIAAGIKKDKKLKKINFEKYAVNIINYNKNISNDIAVIYAQGIIFYGKGTETSIGQETFLKAINKAAKNKKVKAIVLRINSPGGAALTADILWHAIEKAKKEKPIIVSMGDLAASGGYYIACNADKIFADPMTITGSIGVFAAIPNVSKFIESIGINSQQVITHPHAAGYSSFQENNYAFKVIAKKKIKDIYNTFKKRVAEGRNIPLSEVEKIAQGRIWSGENALKNKLIDTLGNLDNAINYAAKKVNIEKYNIITYPKIDPNFENIIEGFLPFSKIKIPEPFHSLKTYFENRDEKIKIHTLLPYNIEIN